MIIHCKTNSGQQIYVFKFASQTSRFIPVKNYKLGSFLYSYENNYTALHIFIRQRPASVSVLYLSLETSTKFLFKHCTQ